MGRILSDNISWNEHIDEVVIKAGRRLDILSNLMYHLDWKFLDKMYKSYVRPILEYGEEQYSHY